MCVCVCVHSAHCINIYNIYMYSTAAIIKEPNAKPTWRNRQTASAKLALKPGSGSGSGWPAEKGCFLRRYTWNRSLHKERVSAPRSFIRTGFWFICFAALDIGNTRMCVCVCVCLYVCVCVCVCVCRGEAMDGKKAEAAEGIAPTTLHGYLPSCCHEAGKPVLQAKRATMSTAKKNLAPRLG